MIKSSTQLTNTANSKPNTPSSPTKEELEAIFQTAPTPYLLLKADSRFTVMDVNEAYLKAIRTKRENLIGKGFFTIFPTYPTDTNKIGADRLQISLQKVIQSGQMDVMRVQKFDLPKPQEKGGGLEQRYWISTQTPVLDQERNVTIILHQVSDATEFEKRKTLSERDETKDRQRYYADVETLKDCQSAILVWKHKLRHIPKKLMNQ